MYSRVESFDVASTSSSKMLIRPTRTSTMERCTIILVFVILLSKLNRSTTFNYPLIKEYLLWNNINAALFITCERVNRTNDPNVMVNLEDDDVWTNVWRMSSEKNLSHFDYERFLRRSGYTVCVIVDWNCSETLNVLKEISARKMFHYERYWLMVGTNSERMFNVLSRELINIDAEVAVVVPVTKS